MVEVIKKGAYLVDGQIVYADQAQNVATPDEAREKTIAYSILRAHNKGKDPKKMQIKFDALISHDITFVGIIQTAKASGLKEFPIPYAMTNCHNSLCAVGGTINEDDHRFGLTAAQKLVKETLPIIGWHMTESAAEKFVSALISVGAEAVIE